MNIPVYPLPSPSVIAWVAVRQARLTEDRVLIENRLQVRLLNIERRSVDQTSLDGRRACHSPKLTPQLRRDEVADWR
jgi:hypothetical protein